MHLHVRVPPRTHRARGRGPPTLQLQLLRLCLLHRLRCQAAQRLHQRLGRLAHQRLQLLPQALGGAEGGQHGRHAALLAALLPALLPARLRAAPLVGAGGVGAVQDGVALERAG